MVDLERLREIRDFSRISKKIPIEAFMRVLEQRFGELDIGDLHEIIAACHKELAGRFG